MAGLFQIASLRHPIGQGLPDHNAYQVVGRNSVEVDRMQARVIVDPKADGSLPTEDAIRTLERAIGIKLAVDRNETRMVTVGEIPMVSFQQLQGGPIPVPKFRLMAGEECKIYVRLHPNLYQASIFKDYPGVYVEVVFYGVEQ